ncbi:hypothetical protein GOP47_0021443 [Adiantum capillus-veneris]|uniref:GPR1/FUN34/yaaH family protein n=1 Tax=Adiantum capillus-veneris TaxID=13818 RepID=A0A9D4U9L4_ADICA|nr:hypothetical protein GOP47_0021443 [Adiantum capillus-veneris]
MAIANPGPLGLGAFALTTFVLSCYNAGIFGVSTTDPVNVITGLALFYGGLAQILAGMWEFAVGNTFGATAFTSYGAFWLAFATFLIPSFGVGAAYTAAQTPDSVVLHASAIFLLAWTIFTFLMFVASLRTTIALALLFLFLTITFALLTAAEFGSRALGDLGSFTNTHRVAGFFGIATAALAWYSALAGLLGSQPRPLFTLPVGRFPLRFVVGPSSASSSSPPTKSRR